MSDDEDGPLLIDTHDRPADKIVWDLFEHSLARLGATPTLIERDADVPAWMVLKAEAERAEAIMFRARPKGTAL